MKHISKGEKSPLDGVILTDEEYKQIIEDYKILKELVELVKN